MDIASFLNRFANLINIITSNFSFFAHRYSFVDLELVRPMQVRHLYDSDVLSNMSERKSFVFLRDSVKFDDPDIRPTLTTISERDGRLAELDSSFYPLISVLMWFQQRLSPYPLALSPPIVDLSNKTWGDGRALRCLLHKYRPDLVADETITASIDLERVVYLFAKNFGVPNSVPCDAEWPRYLCSLYNCLKNHNPAFVANMTGRNFLSLFVLQMVQKPVVYKLAIGLFLRLLV